MKVGDVLKSSGIIPRMPVRAIEGEAHPLGALPVGTLVNSVEMRPGWGSNWAMAAGTACQIIRQASVQDSVNDHVILRLPSKQEVNLSRECIATVGRCSNPEHKHMVIGGPLQKRYLGYRPRSGLWHRKDGTCGRKIRPLPPIRIYDKLTSDSGSSGGLVNELKPSYHATNKFADMDKKDKRYKNYMALQKRMQYKRKNLLIAYYNNLNSRPYISPAEKCRLISLTPRFINLDR
ncbi:large ribosomal subunit protein uL2m-like isoform X2 [Gordionus sp. m RMFG-2023]